jgi:hypothetical protein
MIPAPIRTRNSRFHRFTCPSSDLNCCDVDIGYFLHGRLTSRNPRYICRFDLLQHRLCNVLMLRQYVILVVLEARSPAKSHACVGGAFEPVRPRMRLQSIVATRDTTGKPCSDDRPLPKYWWIFLDLYAGICRRISCVGHAGRDRHGTFDD